MPIVTFHDSVPLLMIPYSYSHFRFPHLHLHFCASFPPPPPTYFVGFFTAFLLVFYMSFYVDDYFNVPLRHFCLIDSLVYSVPPTAVQQSPTTIPLADRFSSNHISTVKRSLFSSGQSPSAGNVPSTTTVSAPTTITVSPKKPAFIDTLNIPGNLVQQASRAGSNYVFSFCFHLPTSCHFLSVLVHQVI